MCNRHKETAYPLDMQRRSARIEKGFDGQYNSHGGSQFLGNDFNTGGAPIYIDSSSGMSRIWGPLRTRNTAHEL